MNQKGDQIDAIDEDAKVINVEVTNDRFVKVYDSDEEDGKDRIKEIVQEEVRRTVEVINLRVREDFVRDITEGIKVLDVKEDGSDLVVYFVGVSSHSSGADY